MRHTYEVDSCIWSGTEMIFSQVYFVVPPQLTLPVEFLFEILFVGVHPQAHYCKLTFRQLLCGAD